MELISCTFCKKTGVKLVYIKTEIEMSPSLNQELAKTQMCNSCFDKLKELVKDGTAQLIGIPTTEITFILLFKKETASGNIIRIFKKMHEKN